MMRAVDEFQVDTESQSTRTSDCERGIRDPVGGAEHRHLAGIEPLVGIKLSVAVQVDQRAAGVGDIIDAEAGHAEGDGGTRTERPGYTAVVVAEESAKALFVHEANFGIFHPHESRGIPVCGCDIVGQRRMRAAHCESATAEARGHEFTGVLRDFRLSLCRRDHERHHRERQTTGQ